MKKNTIKIILDIAMLVAFIFLMEQGGPHSSDSDGEGELQSVEETEQSKWKVRINFNIYFPIQHKDLLSVWSFRL